MLLNNDKQKRLDEIAQEIENCEKCHEGKIGKMVFGEGNIDAKIIFVGEAPGKQEAESGRPFIGRSGKFLRSLIKEIGFKEEDIYITSPVKYLPLKGTPNKSDIDHARSYFLKQLDVINPRIIVLLGSVACKTVLEKPIFVVKDHGKIFEGNGRFYFITFHPAAAIRFAKNKKLIEEDFSKLKSLVNKFGK